MCKVSIIIPCYNVQSDLLHRCLASIESQSFLDYEVIVVDDGSDSIFQKAFEGIESVYKNVYVFHQENNGVSAARNKGLEQSKGEYITFVDADDYLFPNFLEEAVSTAKAYKADIVFGKNITTYTTDTSYPEIVGSHNVSIYENEKIKEINKWMMGRVLGHLDGIYLGQGPWNRLVSRQLAENTLFDRRLPIGEDIVWNLRLLQKAGTVCIVDSVWYVYYVNPTSSSRKYRENAIKESYDSLMAIRNCLDLDDDEQYLSYCYRCWGDLKRIYHCFLSYCGENAKEQRKYLFNSAPWNELKSKRFQKLCDAKHSFMKFLYTSRLVFDYYHIKSVLVRRR